MTKQILVIFCLLTTTTVAFANNPLLDTIERVIKDRIVSLKCGEELSCSFNTADSADFINIYYAGFDQNVSAQTAIFSSSGLNSLIRIVVSNQKLDFAQAIVTPPKASITSGIAYYHQSEGGIKIEGVRLEKLSFTVGVSKVKGSLFNDGSELAFKTSFVGGSGRAFGQ